MKRKIPKRLYKYRAFSDLTAQILVTDSIFFASPSTFNDPLDSKPYLTPDLEVEQLKSLFGSMVEQRRNSELHVAANSLNYRGPKTMAHIRRHSLKAAAEAMKIITYNASASDGNQVEALKFFLAQAIEQELMRRYGAGIFCLAERADCPLMWSHYANQHKGVCLGYSVPPGVEDNVMRISYENDREVKASDVAAMLSGNEQAKKRVDSAVLCRKAPSWGYEREWRLIGEQGLQRNPLELEEVIFGMRCSSGVVFSLVKALEGRERQVKFFQMRENRISFDLEKAKLEFDEMEARFPLRSNDIYDWFEVISDSE